MALDLEVSKNGTCPDTFLFWLLLWQIHAEACILFLTIVFETLICGDDVENADEWNWIVRNVNLILLAECKYAIIGILTDSIDIFYFIKNCLWFPHHFPLLECSKCLRQIVSENTTARETLIGGNCSRMIQTRLCTATVPGCVISAQSKEYLWHTTIIKYIKIYYSEEVRNPPDSNTPRDLIRGGW